MIFWIFGQSVEVDPIGGGMAEVDGVAGSCMRRTGTEKDTDGLLLSLKD